MVDSDSRFHFVPFANQKEGHKFHLLDLPVDFPPLTGNYEGPCRMPRCDQSLQMMVRDYSFRWKIRATDLKLICVVRNTPQFKCSHSHIFLPGEAAIPIAHRAALVRNYFEFPETGSLDRLMKILSPDDLLKVIDFTIAMRQEPFFMLDKNERAILAHLQETKP